MSPRLLILALALASALGPSLGWCPPAAAESPPFYVRTLSEGFNQVSQLVQRTDGAVFIADTYNFRVVVYSEAGDYMTAGPFSNHPSGVVFDHAGNLFVANQGAHNVSKYSPSLVFLGSFGAEGTGPGQLTYPTNLAISPDGTRLYVTEFGGNRVTMFDPNLNFLGTFGSGGAGPGQFDHPWGIAVNAVGEVFVSDELNHRIERFDAAGNFLGAMGGAGSAPGQYNVPTGLAFDAVGSLYVCDELNNRVQKFSNTGDLLSIWGTYGNGPGEFYNEWAILPLRNGELWVSNTYNYRIDVFSYLATPVRRTSWHGLKALYR